MSRSISTTSHTSNTRTAHSPSALQITAIRAGLGLAVAASLLAFAARASGAQQSSTPTLSIRPIAGALVGTGKQHELLKNAALVGAQGTLAVSQNFAVVGSFGYSRSKDKTSINQQQKVDLYQYDLGIEGKLDDLTAGSAVSTRPFLTLGAGARTYDLRNAANSAAKTSPLGYGAVGLDLGKADGGFGVRFEARDNVTAFKGLRGELASRTARNDLQFSAGLTFGF
jgi:hypothetical protein